MRSFAIIFILSLLTVSVFGQNSSSATASATIVTSVGAESNGNIDFSNINAGIYNNTSAGIKLSSVENSAITSINIIGGSFVYDVTVQNDPIAIGTGKNNCKMKVNLFKMSAVNNSETDKTVLSIGALLSVDESIVEGFRSTLPFTVTINFN